MFGKSAASLLLAILIGAGYACWRLAHRPHGDRKAATAEQLEEASERNDPGCPQPAVDDREALPGAPEIKEPDVSPTVRPADVASANPDPPAPPRLNLTYEQYRDQLQAAFDAEPVDSTWSEAAAARLIERLATKLPAGSTLGVVQCRSTMCRVTAQHRDADASGHFSDDILLLTRDDWTGGGLILADHQTKKATIAFLGRSGTFLPSPVESPAARGGT